MQQVTKINEITIVVFDLQSVRHFYIKTYIKTLLVNAKIKYIYTCIYIYRQGNS